MKERMQHTHNLRIHILKRRQFPVDTCVHARRIARSIAGVHVRTVRQRNMVKTILPYMIRIDDKSVQLVIGPFEFASDLGCEENRHPCQQNAGH